VISISRDPHRPSSAWNMLRSPGAAPSSSFDRGPASGAAPMPAAVLLPEPAPLLAAGPPVDPPVAARPTVASAGRDPAPVPTLDATALAVVAAIRASSRSSVAAR